MQRILVVVPALISSDYDGLATQVRVGVDEGLKHENNLRWDEHVSRPKSSLMSFGGSLSVARHEDLARALRVALDIP